MNADLRTIPNIGKQIKKDLLQIGIQSVEDLKNKNPEILYHQVCQATGFKQDRCLLYVFRMAVYYASTDTPEEKKLKWWYWKDKQ